MELILTGDTISGTELQALGLVNKIFPKSEVVSAAVSLAERIAASSAPVVKAAKQGILLGKSLPIFPPQHCWQYV